MAGQRRRGDGSRRGGHEVTAAARREPEKNNTPPRSGENSRAGAWVGGLIPLKISWTWPMSGRASTNMTVALFSFLLFAAAGVEVAATDAGAPQDAGAATSERESTAGA